MADMAQALHPSKHGHCHILRRGRELCAPAQSGDRRATSGSGTCCFHQKEASYVFNIKKGASFSPNWGHRGELHFQNSPPLLSSFHSEKKKLGLSFSCPRKCAWRERHHAAINQMFMEPLLRSRSQAGTQTEGIRAASTMNPVNSGSSGRSCRSWG